MPEKGAALTSFNEWKPKFTFDGAFLEIDVNDLPIIAFCKQKIVAHHMHWNFLNRKIVYFTANKTGSDGSKCKGLVNLKCIRSGCPYHLICKGETINLFSRNIPYFYVDHFVDHNCSSICPEEKTRLRNISDAWRSLSKSIINDVPQSGPVKYSKSDIVKYFIALDRGQISADKRDKFIETNQLFKDLSNWFRGFKILETTASSLKINLETYFVYILNPKYLSCSATYTTLSKPFEDLFRFHPHFYTEKDREDNIKQFLKCSRNHFQNPKTLIPYICGVLLLILMRKPNSSFFVRYDSLESAVASKEKGKHLNKFTNSINDNDNHSSRPAITGDMESMIVTEQGIDFIETKSLPFNQRESSFAEVRKINTDGLYESEAGFDFTKRINEKDTDLEEITEDKLETILNEDCNSKAKEPDTLNRRLSKLSNLDFETEAMNYPKVEALRDDYLRILVKSHAFNHQELICQISRI